MRLRIVFFFILLGFLAEVVSAYETENLGSDQECMKLLDLLATMEGFNYSEVAFAKDLFGDEKINFEVKTWKGNCSFGIGTLSGRIVIVSNKPFKNPTLLAFTDSATLKTLFRNPDVSLFQVALKEGRIRIEPVGFAQGIKLGLVNTLGRFYPPAGNLTFPTSIIPTEDDLDGDGVPNSADACDPYVLKEREGAQLVKYYTCPSFSSRIGEEYYGSRPYDDIYDYVMENGCGVRDTDGGIRYYTKGSICVENVSFTPPQMRRGAFGQEVMMPAQATSSCEVKYTDYCLDSETLVEYYYETPRKVTQRFFNPITKQMELREVLISGGVRNTTYKCPFGCSDGACIVRDLDSMVYPYDPAYYGNELRYGFNPWERSYYGGGALSYVALKTGKRIDEITNRDFFGDECIDERKLREYYLTVETTLGAFGRLEDRVVIKSDEYTCPTTCIDRECIGHGDLSIVSAEPVQVVYGAPLIKGKGTAFRVVLNSTFDVPLQVEFKLELPRNQWSVLTPYPDTWLVGIPANAKNYEVMLPYIPEGREGETIDSLREGLILGTSITPPQTPSFSGLLNVTYRNVPRPIADRVSFTVKVDPNNKIVETNERNNEIIISNIEVKTTKPFKVMYFIHVPNSSYINATKGEIQCSVQTCRPCKACNNMLMSDVFQRALEVATKSTEYLLGVSPVADTKMGFAINFSVNDQNDDNSGYWSRILRIANAWGYDAAVSIDPCDSCGCSSPDDGKDYVCNIGGASGWKPPTVAHELLSHEILKFGEECYHCTPYCGNSDVDCASCVASDGFWVNRWVAYEGGSWQKAQSGGCRGWRIIDAKYYACGVSSETITWQRLDKLWNGTGNPLPGGYLDLISKFEDRNDPLVLLVSGKVYKNGSAEFDPYFEVMEGVANVEPHTTEDYAIILLDSKGNVIEKYGFNIHFELLTHEGVVHTDKDSFVLMIPWDERTKRIELQDKTGNVLASKSVSLNKPRISIISPKEGDVFRENERILVKWIADDADRDKLMFSLGFSKDGKDWVPLVANFEGEDYWIDANSLSRGYYWIKVRVSDGVNTAEAISGKFFVDVPEIEKQKEVCGDGFCNTNFENSLNCPQDCPTGIGDGVCDRAKDNRVDPDCKEGVDPDDTSMYEESIAEAHGKSDTIVYGALLVGIAAVLGVVGVYKLLRRK